MCKFKSGVILKNKVVLAPIYNDSHSNLLAKLGIEDTYENAIRKFVRAELVPPNGDKTWNVSKWQFIVDQDEVPEWYKTDAGKYEEEFRTAVKEWMDEHFTVICGVTCVKMKEDEKGVYYMTADPIFESKFSNTDNNYTTSIVRKKLQDCDFAKALRKEYGDRLVPLEIDLTSFDGFKDYGNAKGDILGLRNLDLHRECRENIPNAEAWEWLATPNSTPSSFSSGSVRYVCSDGYVDDYWYGNVRAVRPFFIIQSLNL